MFIVLWTWVLYREITTCYGNDKDSWFFLFLPQKANKLPTILTLTEIGFVSWKVDQSNKASLMWTRTFFQLEIQYQHPPDPPECIINGSWLKCPHKYATTFLLSASFHKISDIKATGSEVPLHRNADSHFLVLMSSSHVSTC